MNKHERISLTDEQIKNIANELGAGFNVFLNIRTKETKSIIDFDNNPYAIEEQWEEDIKEIEENHDNYFAFERMESRESFQVMVEFVETMKDEKLKEKLELILSLAKPFRNFKDIIDNEEGYRQKWFAFSESKYVEFVRDQLERYNSRINTSPNNCLS